MHPGSLDVTHDAGNEHIGAVTDGVHLALDALKISVDEHGPVRAGMYGLGHVGTQLVGAVDDGHGPTTDDVGRAHQHRESEILGNGQGLLGRTSRATGSLWNVQFGQQRLESLPVLGPVQVRQLGAEDSHPVCRQRGSEVDGRLTAELDDDSLRLLQIDDVQDVLDGERLEVQLVGDGEVGGDRLRVRVHDDGLVASSLDRLDAVDGGVVELDALPDADRAGSQYEDAGTIAARRLVLLLVAGVEVRGLRLELTGAGVHHLVDRDESVVVASLANLIGGALPGPRDGRIGESVALGGAQQVDVARIGGQGILELDDVGEFVEEEEVDAGEFVQLANGAAATQGLGKAEQSIVPSCGDPLDEDVIGQLGDGRGGHMVDADLQGAHRLEQGLLDGASQRHDLTGRLHLGAQAAIGTSELVERPARNLGDDVVEHRLEHGPRRAGDRIAYLVEGETDGDLGGDLGDRVAGGLGGQRRGPRHPRVDLDDVVVERGGVQGELDIAPTLDTQCVDDGDRRVTQHLVLDVGEGLGGSEDDGVAGVHAHRVEVLHGAHHHGVPGTVSHHLVLDLLESGDRLFDEALIDRGEFQALAHHAHQICLVIADPATGTAQGVGGTHDEWVAESSADLDGLHHRVDDVGGRDRLAEILHELLEEVTVLGLLDGRQVGAEKFDAELVEDPAFGEVTGHVETGLAAQGGHDGLGALPAQDLADELQGDRLDVDPVGDLTVGHDGGRVGVDEDDLVTLLTQGQAGLGSGVVELCGLTDDDRAGSDDEDAVDVGAAWHQHFPSARALRWERIRSMKSSKRWTASWGPAAASGWYCTENDPVRRLRTPSMVSSLISMWVTSRSVPVSDWGSTAYP